MAKMSRKQLWWKVIGGAVFLFLAIIVLRIWVDYRLIKTGNIDLVSIFGSQDKFSRAAGGSGGNAVTPVWEKESPSLGDAAAPIALIEFADFGCSFSKDESSVLRELLIKYPSVFRLQFRNFPIVELHPGAERAAAAGVCANEQGKFWPMHDKLFADQGAFSDADLAKYGSEIGLDAGKFSKCIASSDAVKKVNDDIGAGKMGGVSGTPTFFVSFGNGASVKIEGAVPSDVWEKIRAFFVKK
jgi:Protein-disulfide isomerase